MTEVAWRRRFRAPNISLPSWARDRDDRAVYGSNATGKWEIYAWDLATDTHRQVTDRPSGTQGAVLDPSGEWIWWFDDTKGNELGLWMRAPWDGSSPPEPAVPGLEPAYHAGLAVGTGLSVVGQSVRGEHRFHLCREGQAPVMWYRSDQAAGISSLSRDESLVAYTHAEHGDSRNRAVRVVDLDANVVAELWDGPGKGVAPGSWSRVPGDRRLIVTHERTGIRRPAIWEPESDKLTDVDVDLPGELGASWYPDAAALLLTHLWKGRTELYRYDIATRSTTPVEIEPGRVAGARIRPDGELWYAITTASTPPKVRARRDGSSRVLLEAPGEQAPEGVAYTDLEVGEVHALVAEPSGPRPHPTVFQIHGGPAGMDAHSFSPGVQAWVDHGFAVVLVNYRGSSGYGKAWRDALVGNLGFTEMEDIVAVRDQVVADGIADPERIVLSGGSWGGYLTLFGLGTSPDKWSLGISSVPLADLPSHYYEQAEPLRVYFRSLAGGSPEDIPDVYERSSPITYAEKVAAPLLILAGENDPRCPIGQVNSYVDRMESLGKQIEVYRYDAGHGSLVMDETIRQAELRIAFASRHLGTPPPAQ